MRFISRRSREAPLEAALNGRAQWLEDPSGSVETALALKVNEQREVIRAARQKVLDALAR